MKHANVAFFVPHIGCPNQCSFCNQRTISGHPTMVTPQEVASVCQQALVDLGERAPDSQIGFFGGSFTAIDRETMVSLLKAAAPYVGVRKFQGIRVSTRPDAIDKERLEILQEYGVTAIELGAQSMDDHVLQLNGRGHTAQDVRRSGELITTFGIELGVQMMVGLYGDSDEGAMQTARELDALNPQTVRIYPTIVLEGTPLADLYRQGIYQPLSLDKAVELCSRLLLFFEGRNRKVIRMGLHAEQTLEQGRIAGPYHPAFRELCESRIFLEKALSALKKRQQSHFLIQVAPSAVSKMIGQHRCNLRALEQEGYRVRVEACPALKAYEINIQEEPADH